jgi:hypothetical protein
MGIQQDFGAWWINYSFCTLLMIQFYYYVVSTVMVLNKVGKFYGIVHVLVLCDVNCRIVIFLRLLHGQNR